MEKPVMRLSELASHLQFQVIRDGEFKSLGALSHRSPHMLVCLHDESYLPVLQDNECVSCVITSPVLADRLSAQWGVAASEAPQRTFYRVHEHLHYNTDFYWTAFDTTISDLAQIHPAAFVAEKNVQIGRGTIIEHNVTILERSIVGNNVIIRCGSVIGSEGLAFNRLDGERWTKLVHAGGLRIHDDVEIMSNCVVDRNAFGGFTEIGENTKVAHLVRIGHNVTIGKRCRISGCTLIAGSSTIGDDVILGPNCTVSSEISIGDRARISLGSVVTRDVPEDARVSGNFAIDHDKFIAFIKSIR
jgi:UDP-3-O-[3-hydroxymyristoyl] glucosamine N-acyltransferase